MSCMYGFDFVTTLISSCTDGSIYTLMEILNLTYIALNPCAIKLMLLI